MSEMTRADAIALYGNGERAWKRSEGYVEVDPRDLMRLCETFLNTRPAPPPSREGWLDEDEINEWRRTLLDRFLSVADGQEAIAEELNALCDMALSALRPAGDEGIRVALPERPITSLAYSAQLSTDQFLSVQRLVKAMDAYADALEAALHTDKGDSRG